MADTWTFVRIALANPELDTAIDTVALKQTANDPGALFIWVDDIRAVVDVSAVWTELHHRHWGIGQDNRLLNLFETAWRVAGYALLKMEGRKKPTVLNADATECDISPEYIITKATELAMRARGDRRRDRRGADVLVANDWLVIAQQQKQRMQMPDGVKWVSNP